MKFVYLIGLLAVAGAPMLAAMYFLGLIGN